MIGDKNKDDMIISYLTEVVTKLNQQCNNVIKEEKFQRAILMFTNRPESYETIKKMIDWHAENERHQYLELLKSQKAFLSYQKDLDQKQQNKKLILEQASRKVM